MQTGAGKLTAGADRRAGQGYRDVAKDHFGMAIRLPGHGVELIDCQPDGGLVATLALAVGQLPPSGIKSTTTRAGRPPAKPMAWYGSIGNSGQ